MADNPTNQADDPNHRGRIQAQGGGTEKSVSWAQGSPPNQSEMLDLCDNLESRLTAAEKKDRAQPMAQTRRYIQSAAQGGGVSAPVSKTWLKRGSKDIRIDLEIIKGKVCVPDP